MSNPSTVILQLSAAASNGVAQAQAVVGAGAVTLNGSLVSGGVATLGTAARRVVAASSGADAGAVITLTGTSRDGNTQTEALTLVNSPASVYTNLDFLTISAASSDRALVGNITIGTNGVGSSVWVMDDYTKAQWQLRVGVSLPGGSGSVTYTVEHTYDDPAKVGASLVIAPQQFSVNPAGYVPPLAWPDANLVGVSANGETNYADGPVMAHRLTITAGTGVAVMQSIQAGMGDI